MPESGLNRFEQLDLAVAAGQKGHLHILLGEGFFGDHQPESVTVDAQGCVQVFDDHRHVVDPFYGQLCSLSLA